MDRCPYSRVLSADFRECPAFTPVEFAPLDTQYTPLTPVITCRHLEPGSTHEGAGFYPKCALGDAAARLAWVERVGQDRLAKLRELSIEYRGWAGELMPQLWERKAAVLAAESAHRDSSEEKAELKVAIAELTANAEAWIDARGDRLREVGLAPDAVKPLVRVAIQAWANTPTAGVRSWVSEQILEEFPPEVQAFIRAGRQPG